MSYRITQLRHWKIGLKNLEKEDKIIDNLYKYIQMFRDFQRGSVIKLETFHLLVAVSILENGLYIFKNQIKKDKMGLERNIRKYKRKKK